MSSINIHNLQNKLMTPAEKMNFLNVQGMKLLESDKRRKEREEEERERKKKIENLKK